MSVRERVFAALYDPLGAQWEKKHGEALRRDLLSDVHGRVLEIGVGTGLSFPHYPDVEEIVGVEPSEPMLRRARRRAAETGCEIQLVQAPAEELPFPDESFDTVVAMTVLCTVDDLDRALAEIHRVLRPDGRFVFVEHVRADDPKLARWQDRMERPWQWFAGGCHPNRRTLQAIDSAGFEVTGVEEGELAGVPRLVRTSIKGAAGKR